MKTFGRTGSLIRRALVLLLGIFFIGAFIYNVLPDIILIRQGRWLAHKEWLQSLHPNTIHSLAMSVLYYGIFGAISSASLLAMGIFVLRSWNIRRWKGVAVCAGICLVIYVAKEIIGYLIAQPDSYSVPIIGLWLYPAMILYAFTCKYLYLRSSQQA